MQVFALSDGSRMRLHDLPGTGAPILFIHGLGCAGSSDYPAVARTPALAGRRIWLVDLLGFGFSDRPASFGYTIADHVHALAALLTRDAGPVDVYGHSLGGAIAIELAAAAPARIGRLVVSEPNLRPGSGSFSRAIAAHPEAHYVAAGHAETVRDQQATGNGVWAGCLAVASPLAVHRAAVDLVRGSAPTWLEQLRDLALPRVALWGARSLPDPDAELVARADVPLRIVPDAGHSMAYENPTGLAAAIAEALP